MGIIGRNILQKQTLKRKPVQVPEWEGIVILRELTGYEAAPVSQGALAIQQARQEGKADAAQVVRWQAETLAAGWINEDGSHVLQNGDIDTLIQSTSNAVIGRLAKEVRILSGLEAASETEDRPGDEAKKNLAKTANGASGSS